MLQRLPPRKQSLRHAIPLDSTTYNPGRHNGCDQADVDWFYEHKDDLELAAHLFDVERGVPCHYTMMLEMDDRYFIARLEHIERLTLLLNRLD